jgi:protein phosphatase
MRLVVGAATDVGRVREGNEDGYLVDEAVGLMAVADGMGGHRAGEVASATALEALRAAVNSGRPVREAVEDANQAVFAKSLTDTSLMGMGTTLTAGTLVAGGTLMLAHVGDSRAYLLHDGELKQVTLDHSHVEELVREGKLTQAEAAVHPMRSVITRSIGVDEDVDVDVYPVELHPGDRVLLCSDGLSGMVHAETIAAELRREDDPNRAAQRLVDAANAAGGEDNITVVVIAVTDEDPVRDPAPAVLAVAEPAPDAGTSADAAPEDGKGRHRIGRVARIALWVLPILLVIGVAIGVTAWYARKDYFVSLDRSHVTVYKGVPGGLLAWNPTIEHRTTLTADELRPADLASVRDQPKFGSLARANAYVAQLRRASTSTTTPTTSTAPTTSTVAPTTSVVPTTTPAGP